MSTPRERRRDGTMRLRLQISEYFEVYIKVCQSTICAIMHHDSPIAAMRKSLFRHAKRALPRLRKASSATLKALFRHTETAFLQQRKYSAPLRTGRKGVRNRGSHSTTPFLMP